MVMKKLINSCKLLKSFSLTTVLSSVHHDWYGTVRYQTKLYFQKCILSTKNILPYGTVEATVLVRYRQLEKNTYKMFNHKC